MNEENLIIAYGDKRITLNKGDQHIALENEEVAYMIESILRQMTFKISYNK